jgi:hypothetical protein
MAERILFPEWRKQNDTTKYPFSERATLVNRQGKIILEGVFADANLYPIGGTVGLYLTRIDVSHSIVTLYVGNEGNTLLCSTSFSILNPPTVLQLKDSYSRPAGVLVSDTDRLSVFQTLGIGTHTFERTHTEFSATVCVPVPEIGVRGVLLDDGTLLAGDVWLVGADGVVLRKQTVTQIINCGSSVTRDVIRVDVVGDPLYRRRLCDPQSLFTTVNPVKTVRFIAENLTFDCSSADGNVGISVNNAAATDTILRITNTETGIKISTAGA